MGPVFFVWGTVWGMDIYLMLELFKKNNPDFIFFSLAEKDFMNSTGKAIFMLEVGNRVGKGKTCQRKRGYICEVTP